MTKTIFVKGVPNGSYNYTLSFKTIDSGEIITVKANLDSRFTWFPKGKVVELYIVENEGLLIKEEMELLRKEFKAKIKERYFPAG